MAEEVKLDPADVEHLLQKLRPVLMEAIQGNFTSRIEMEEGDPLNEIYAGVQTLLDVICEQIKVLDEMGAQLSENGPATYASLSAPAHKFKSRKKPT